MLNGALYWHINIDFLVLTTHSLRKTTVEVKYLNHRQKPFRWSLLIISQQCTTIRFPRSKHRLYYLTCTSSQFWLQQFLAAWNEYLTEYIIFLYLWFSSVASRKFVDSSPWVFQCFNFFLPFFYRDFNFKICCKKIFVLLQVLKWIVSIYISVIEARRSQLW